MIELTYYNCGLPDEDQDAFVDDAIDVFYTKDFGVSWQGSTLTVTFWTDGWSDESVTIQDIQRVTEMIRVYAPDTDGPHLTID